MEASEDMFTRSVSPEQVGRAPVLRGVKLCAVWPGACAAWCQLLWCVASASDVCFGSVGPRCSADLQTAAAAAALGAVQHTLAHGAQAERAAAALALPTLTCHPQLCALPCRRPTPPPTSRSSLRR